MPLTNKNWTEQRHLEIEVFSDPKLDLSSVVVGTRDLNEYFLNLKGARLGGKYLVPLPGVALFNNHGILKAKLLIPDPNDITTSVYDVQRMAGLTA